MINFKDLPVYQQKDRIINELKNHSVIVVESPTGSGKTTQIPLILHEAGYSQKGIIGVTQPRRIAALSVSEFIAKQIGCEVGSLAGYKMRFEDKTSSETLIKIMTDGILLQELKTDPLLERYSVIMVDEAHERSLNIDFILGLLKKILESRPELKIIISSATINSAIFSTYFHDCPIVKIETPIYPIELHYQPISQEAEEEELYRRIADLVKNYVEHKESIPQQGDILIFLQGEKNIKDCIETLTRLPISESLFLLPLYGRLSKEEQESVFIPTPEGKTKVVIATNIAETSVTINKIAMVIDSGLAKINFYNPYTFTSSLIEQKISRASANQRKGRAGRTGAGICYRLYSESDFNQREEFTVEEIYRTDLSEVLLRMSDLAITDFEGFDYISPPTKEGIIGAIQTLKLLNAIDQSRQLTPIGKRMVYFPLMPRHARMIVEAIMNYPDVLEEVIIAASFLSTNSPFLLPQGEEIEARLAHHSFRDRFGDFVSYLKIFRRFQSLRNEKEREQFCHTYFMDLKTMHEIVSIKAQLEEMVGEKGIPVLSGGGIRDYLLAVSTGLIQFVCANYRNNSYRSMTAEKIAIHPGSVMFKESPRYLVAGEIVKTSKIFARSVSPLQKEWLELLRPGLLKELSSTAKKGQKSRLQEKKDRLIIAGKEIPISQGKGKKRILFLSWEEARSIAEKSNYKELLAYSKVRATIRFQGKELFADHKLPNLVLAATAINPYHDRVKANLSGSLNALENPKQLIKKLPLILKLVPYRKKGIAPIALYTNGEGIFWFAPCPSFFSAIDQSLNSLDYLIENIYSFISPEEKKELTSIFSRLTQISQSRTSL